MRLNGKKAKWTLIVYAAGDNNLMASMRRDILQLNAVKRANPDVNVVGLFDSGYQDTIAVQGEVVSEEERQARIGGVKFKLKGEPTEVFPGEVISNEGQVNMGDARTLRDLILWAMREYPAEHYALLIIDHGQGWLGIAEDETPREGSGEEDRLTMGELSQALKDVKRSTGRKLDLVMMDACLMGQLEVLYQLKEYVNLLIASEAREREEGWEYERLNFRWSSDPEELAKAIVDKAYDGYSVRTLAAYDLRKLRSFTSSFNALLRYLLQSLPEEKLAEIFSDIRELPSLAQGFFYDFKDFQSLLDVIERALDGDERGLKLLKDVRDALNELMIKSKSSVKGLRGVSVDANDKVTEDYLRLQMPRETLWDEFLVLASHSKRELENEREDIREEQL